jgi:hypothetical protein
MTKLLQQAVRKVQALPDVDQDAIAALILEELEDEARWDTSFAQSRSALEKLAAEAAAEHRAGKTKPLDPDEL